MVRDVHGERGGEGGRHDVGVLPCDGDPGKPGVRFNRKICDWENHSSLGSRFSTHMQMS